MDATSVADGCLGRNPWFAKALAKGMDSTERRSRGLSGLKA
jgi:hypothetical protein